MALAIKWNSRRIHKWCGLTAAVWLAVLGISGLLLDHRHEWRWLWQSTVPESVVPQSVIDKAKSGVNRLFQVHPRQQGVVVAGGPQGLWRSDNNGEHWRSTHFLNAQSMPTVYAAVLDGNSHRTWLWLATDDGIWLSRDFGDSAQQIELRNSRVTALSSGHSNNMLVGVEDRSRAFEFNTARYHINWLNLEPLDSNTLPEQINLSRFIHDIHFGRGLVHADLDLWINDFAGAALLLLPLTGFLFWYLPKRWRKQQDNKTPAPIKKHTIRWLVRLHGPTVGLLFALPIFYLAISGIFLDHAKELRAWMKTIPITRMLQTPVYSMRSWSGEIYAIAAYPGNPNQLSIGTRTGLYTSNDRGKNWFREKTINGFVWTLKRIDNALFLGGMGAPNRILQNDRWSIAKKSGHMPTDVSIDANGNYYWTNSKGIRIGSPNNEYKSFELDTPKQAGIPWFYFLDALHSGLIFSKHWKWVNDFFAVLAILLVITGLIRWWRLRWI